MNRSFVLHTGVEGIKEFDKGLKFNIIMSFLKDLKSFNNDEKENLETMLKSDDLEACELAEKMIIDATRIENG